MEQPFDVSTWSDVFLRAWADLVSDVVGFLPNLVGGLAILLIGWLIARTIEAIAVRSLRAIGLDGAVSRMNLNTALERAEIGLSASQLMGKLLFWLVLLTFLLPSVEALGLESVRTTLDRLIAWIPNVLGAAAIAIGGLVLGRVAATIVASAAAAADVDGSSRLGLVTRLVVVGVFLVLAAEQLGIETSILIVPLSVLLGAAGLGVALAFALGARPVVTHILAGHFLKQSLPRDTPVEVDGRRGRVERVGAIETILRDDERAWSVPNAQLLERVVGR